MQPWRGIARLGARELRAEAVVITAWSCFSYSEVLLASDFLGQGPEHDDDTIALTLHHRSNTNASYKSWGQGPSSASSLSLVSCLVQPCRGQVPHPPPRRGPSGAEFERTCLCDAASPIRAKATSPAGSRRPAPGKHKIQILTSRDQRPNATCNARAVLGCSRLNLKHREWWRAMPFTKNVGMLAHKSPPLPSQPGLSLSVHVRNMGIGREIRPIPRLKNSSPSFVQHSSRCRSTMLSSTNQDIPNINGIVVCSNPSENIDSGHFTTITFARIILRSLACNPDRLQHATVYNVSLSASSSSTLPSNLPSNLQRRKNAYYWIRKPSVGK